MNPIANVPIFLSLTEGACDADRRRIARVTLIGVTIGCVISAVAGSAILSPKRRVNASRSVGSFEAIYPNAARRARHVCWPPFTALRRSRRFE